MNCSFADIQWFRRRLSSWYKKEGRHFPWRNKSATKYQLIIAEILLQRTKAETVKHFFSGFCKRYPSWKALSNAKEIELREFLKPIGLWKQRSAVLTRLSGVMVKRNGRFPKTRSEITSLPGIGQYITNAIEMFCNGIARPLLDVNMARVLERFWGPRKLADIRYDPYLQDLASRVIPKKNAKQCNWAILDFASLVCKAQKPLCVNCILQRKCQYFKSLDTMQL